MRVRLAPGVVWRELDGSLHAVYSPLSGETHLLNGTSMWVLESLSGPGWHDPEHVVCELAGETGGSEDEVRASLAQLWTTLVDGGLVQRDRALSVA